MDEITATVRDYILKEFLPGEDPEALVGSTPLISGGILDSIATLRLVSFLEEKFNVTLQAHELDAEHLGTLDQITTTVRSKLEAKPR